MECPGPNKALLYKSMAEDNFRQSKLKSALKYAHKALRLQPNLQGVSHMVAAFKILHYVDSHRPPNYYEILGVEPSAQVHWIRKQYKSLVMVLKPNKDVYPLGGLEAFNHVEEAFRVLEDKDARKDYDFSLRISQPNIKLARADTFWTACSTCRLFHQFERRYVGHRLVCPNCRKGFLALEEKEMDEVTKSGNMIQGLRSMGRNNLKKADDVLGQKGFEGISTSFRRKVSIERKRKRVMNLKLLDKNEKLNAGKPKGREMTLTEMKAALKRKLEMSKQYAKGKKGIRNRFCDEKAAIAISNRHDDRPVRMLVQDSDFYDFQMDRMEHNFKKGQIWALYDDDEGMPRHYGLINDVCSFHPFSINMSCLKAHSNAGCSSLRSDVNFIPVSCGRFKAEGILDTNSISTFSHVMKGDRVTEGIYGIFPQKGSVWALYHGERPLDGQVVDSSSRCFEASKSYEIVVLLTSYSEIHGLSAAYLEKVEGFKTIFKRSEVGFHAVKLFEKNDLVSFSHQIPARKFSGEKGPNLPEECWELDPVSLPRSSFTMRN